VTAHRLVISKNSNPGSNLRRGIFVTAIVWKFRNRNWPASRFWKKYGHPPWVF